MPRSLFRRNQPNPQIHTPIETPPPHRPAEDSRRRTFEHLPHHRERLPEIFSGLYQSTIALHQSLTGTIECLQDILDDAIQRLMAEWAVTTAFVQNVRRRGIPGAVEERRLVELSHDLMGAKGRIMGLKRVLRALEEESPGGGDGSENGNGEGNGEGEEDGW